MFFFLTVPMASSGLRIPENNKRTLSDRPRTLDAVCKWAGDYAYFTKSLECAVASKSNISIHWNNVWRNKHTHTQTHPCEHSRSLLKSSRLGSFHKRKQNIRFLFLLGGQASWSDGKVFRHTHIDCSWILDAFFRDFFPTSPSLHTVSFLPTL